MKRLPDVHEIYKRIRKRTPPPTSVQKDRRDELRRKEDRKEMEEHRGGSRGEEREP